MSVSGNVHRASGNNQIKSFSRDDFGSKLNEESPSIRSKNIESRIKASDANVRKIINPVTGNEMRYKITEEKMTATNGTDFHSPYKSLVAQPSLTLANLTIHNSFYNGIQNTPIEI